MLQLTTIIFLIAFSLLAVIHIIAIELYLYWHFWWFDIAMHLFGGAVVALGLFTLRDLRILPNSFISLFKVLLLVLGIALIWEGYEFLIGYPILADFFTDTLLDIICGLIGGYVGFMVGKSLRNLR